MVAPKKKYTSADLRNAIMKKYAMPEWCVFFEVTNDTGTRIRRYADAVAMSIWPSRGYAIHGFEIKVSRSDFLSEMANPQKSDAISQYCDYWWLATPSKLVDPSEVPETWGLLELNGRGLRATKKAPKTEGRAFTRGFAASLLRRAMERQSAFVIRELEKGKAERQASIEREVERKTSRMKEDVTKHKEWIAAFEAELGMPFNKHKSPKDLAATLKLAERLSGEYGLSSLKGLRRSAAALVEEIDSASGLVADVSSRMAAE